MPAQILVIEDNPDNSKLVSWILEDEGYDVTCCETAELGIAKLDSHHFDLVLMDISLPGMDGKQATRLIRADGVHQDLPIIALTAHAIKGEDEEIMASGVNDMLTKPLDEELLVEKLHQYLQ